MSKFGGKDHPLICSQCRHVNPAGSRFCGLCGNELSGSAAPVFGAASTTPSSSYPPSPGYGARPRPFRSKLVAVLASLGVFIFLTPVAAGACAMGGCFVTAMSGGSDLAMGVGALLGVIASLAISVMVFRSMAGG